MTDITLLKTCEHCGSHITLMASIGFYNKETGEQGTLIYYEDGETESQSWLVERCLTCGCHPVTEVVRLYEE